VPGISSAGEAREGTRSDRKRKSTSDPSWMERTGSDEAGPSLGIDIKTKFPVARIKRIIQADEDVGKVAQATPTAMCEF
jgi:hypothetical protein